jgi:hypothetical protein
VAGHRGDPCKDADEVVAEPAAEQRGRSPLADVEDRDREAELEPERAPDVGRARVSAPDGADVDAREDARQPVPPRQRAEEVAGRYEEPVAQV